MTFVKPLPLAVSVAMLATLIYMTFVPSYYLSAIYYDNSTAEVTTLEQMTLPKLTRLLDNELQAFTPKKINNALYLISQEKELANIEKLAIEAKRKTLSTELTKRLTIIPGDNNVEFRLAVKKASIWKEFLQKALLNQQNSEQSFEPNIQWKTDYFQITLVFLLAAILSYLMAFAILISKNKQLK